MKVITPAYVMRRVRWSESSLILTLLSLDFGRISGIAKGAFRPRSSFYGQMEMFSCTEFTLSRREGRELDTITCASVLEYNEGIRNDPLAFGFACLFTEWVLGTVTYGNEPVSSIYHLFGSVIEHLGESEPWSVLCAGVERLLLLSGHGPETDSCTLCGKKTGSTPGWSPLSGGVVCDNCVTTEQNISPGLLEYLRKSREQEFSKIVRTRLWPGGFRQCHELLREFAEVHLDRRLSLKSLAVVEDIENADR